VEEKFYGRWSEFNLEDEGDARRALAEYRYRVADCGETFEFYTLEWDLRDWDFWFLWCCHAIQWGIRQYDQARAACNA
jgi:hypothetical protein